MTGLVEQLQSDALDHTVPVSTLLRKVKVCAAKLGLDDALAWVTQELNGYTCPSNEMPDYRQGFGSTMCQDQYGRWVPFVLDRADWADTIASIDFREPVSNYEDMLRTDGTTFDLPLDNELLVLVNNLTPSPIIGLRNKIARGHIHRIVERVRTMVLDWALELARRGITGDGMSFSASERARANEAHISIGTFTGSFNTGDATGDGASISQITTFAPDNSVFQELTAAIRNEIRDEIERDALLEAASQMSKAKDKSNYLARYERFLAVAANHMTVVAPFLPALASMAAG